MPPHSAAPQACRPTSYVKFVVRPGFTAKTADAKTGQRANISANYLQTAGRIGAVNLIERRYVRVG